MILQILSLRLDWGMSWAAMQGHCYLRPRLGISNHMLLIWIVIDE